MPMDSILGGGGGYSTPDDDIPNWLLSYQTQANQSNADLYGGAIAEAIAPFYSPEEQPHVGMLTQQSISNDNAWMLPLGIGWNQDFLQGVSSPEEFGYGSQNTPLWNPQAFTFPEQEQQANGGGYYGGYYGGGGGGAPAQEDIEWILGDYDVGGQGPDWWRPFTVENSEHFSNPAVSATLMMNALIGSGALSDEDARTMAKQLYTTWGGQTADNPWDLYSTKFGEREDFEGAPTMQGSFNPFISEQQVALGQTGPGVIGMDRFSRDRSEQALDALNMMREATVGGNINEFGPGYQYLQEIAGTLGEAGSGPASRAEREQILGALDPMMAMSQGGELGAFSGIAQMLANPFHTNLPPNVSRTQAGDYQFGRQNKGLFF